MARKRDPEEQARHVLHPARRGGQFKEHDEKGKSRGPPHEGEDGREEGSRRQGRPGRTAEGEEADLGEKAVDLEAVGRPTSVRPSHSTSIKGRMLAR
jgi:hypothetical protein